MSETNAEESVPKWPGFDVQVPNVEPAAEGQEVALSHLDATGLEFLLEIEMEGKLYFVLVDSGVSLIVMKPGISSSKVQPTLTTAKGITGKHVKLGTAEAILQCAHRMTGFDSRNLEAGETSAGCVNSIRGNNSNDLPAVRTEVERSLAHLVSEERQILMPVLNEYLGLFCNYIEGVLPCTT